MPQWRGDRSLPDDVTEHPLEISNSEPHFSQNLADGSLKGTELQATM
jgi:hypothetical protein